MGAHKGTDRSDSFVGGPADAFLGGCPHDVSQAHRGGGHKGSVGVGVAQSVHFVAGLFEASLDAIGLLPHRF